MGKWDAIIIGGSFSGLATGALLAQAGKEVLILEKQSSDPRGNGRMFTAEYKGQLLDHGTHGYMTMGTAEEVFKRLGVSLPKVKHYKTVKMWYENKWQDFGELCQRSDVAKIFIDHILPYSQEDFEKYDDIELADWISEKTNDEYARLCIDYAGWGGLVGGIADVSAGETLTFLKAAAQTATGEMIFVGCMPEGGQAAISKVLRDKCKELGVEIRHDIKVVDVVFEEGKVRGVEIEQGERIIPPQFMFTEVIEAPLVISTVPIWDLFKVVSEDEFPTWYAEWVKSVAAKYVNLGTIIYGLDKVPEGYGDPYDIWYVPKVPRTGQRLGLIWMPVYSEGVGQQQAHFWFQANWDEGAGGIDPAIWGSSAKIRREVKKFYELLQEDIKEFFPGFEEHCLWKMHVNAHCQTSAVAGNVHKYRPGVQPPGVKGFYITSDTLRDTMPMGTSAAGLSAIKCVDTILENE